MTSTHVIPAAPPTVFWELTRSCPLSCRHCRLGNAISKGEELPDRELKRVADELVVLGVKTVVLTGGEPTARRGWEKVAEQLARGSIRVRLFTSGFPAPGELLARALDAGIAEFAVSLDGPRPIHDALRPAAAGKKSSFDCAVELIREIVRRGFEFRVVTAVNALNAPHLGPVYEFVKELSPVRWQVQLSQNLGRFADHSAELICAPQAVEQIVDVLLRAARERIVHAPLHCTVGYMTAEEPVLRNREVAAPPLWHGCGAGIRTLCITANGSVKGCAALPDEFAIASIRTRTLRDIWGDDQLFPHSRSWSSRLLTGACSRCAFQETCRAGCPAVAYGVTGSIGLNPYCLRLIRSKPQ